MPQVTRVLVVDDDAPTRQLLKLLLERQFFAVDLACDGFEAIEMIRDSDYDMILLDMMMPRVDGRGVIEFLKNSEPAQLSGVVIMSAISPEGLEKLQEEPLRGVIQKPLNVGEFLALAETCRVQ